MMVSTDIQERHTIVWIQSDTQGILVSWEWNEATISWHVSIEKTPVHTMTPGEYEVLWRGEVAP